MSTKRPQREEQSRPVNTESPRTEALLDSDKKAYVRSMFDAIAPKYDLLNRVLSGGIDQRWRKKAVRLVREHKATSVLDVATGTADLAIMAGEELPGSQVVGVDIAEEMLDVGRKKIAAGGLQDQIELQTGDAEDLEFDSAQFDAAMVAFGVRNFGDLAAGLSEIRRVLRDGGILVVLEFSRPTAFPIKQLYSFYGHVILPLVGRIVSGDDAAYTYLPNSIEQFPDGDDFLDVMREAGFERLSERRLTFGIATLYSGVARSA